MILKIGENEKSEFKSIIVVPELPSSIDYVLMTDGQCFVSSQYAKELGGQIHD